MDSEANKLFRTDGLPLLRTVCGYEEEMERGGLKRSKKQNLVNESKKPE